MAPNIAARFCCGAVRNNAGRRPTGLCSLRFPLVEALPQSSARGFYVLLGRTALAAPTEARMTHSESDMGSRTDCLMPREGNALLRRDTHGYASSGPEGGHPPEVLVRGPVGHGQDGGVRVAQLVALVGKRDPPPFVGQALGREGGEPRASRVIQKTSRCLVIWIRPGRTGD